MRRMSLAFAFLAGLGVAVLPMALFWRAQAAQAESARASALRTIALLQVPTESKPPVASEPRTPIEPDLTPPTLRAAEVPAPGYAPEPTLAPSPGRRFKDEATSNASPENSAEEFVNETR